MSLLPFPTQPIINDHDGREYFKPNEIVKFIVDMTVIDPLQFARDVPCTKAERLQFFQLLGLSTLFMQVNGLGGSVHAAKSKNGSEQLKEYLNSAAIYNQLSSASQKVALSEPLPFQPLVKLKSAAPFFVSNRIVSNLMKQIPKTLNIERIDFPVEDANQLSQLCGNDLETYSSMPTVNDVEILTIEAMQNRNMDELTCRTKVIQGLTIDLINLEGAPLKKRA
ncbi:hypothetical protein AB4455_26210 [Vibrio sp. 10N.261.46.E12]|uniref:hypothetical protein n=1 Tax=unclassified Vibrio TaxID=2614977 RepID=UPI0009755047|nr:MULTISPECIES: hypothetical protein [unclassified Vibrio]OMO37695.1 hypothetical protein BH584_21420 [Vibrio sp. 10N.261.45.E1]PMJ36887.1 hypothetical protein BCU27_22705 [Vibrio sp. 10N.286.45.B6]PML93598.1 hypothetical protein BCT66_24340 [Vibrio sp. 10N.261.49.E11]PMM86141.1 hypothetical protein BCT46_08640 [Vibrio sp. 10N.261.46.E8]PMN50174.1 hypothetical protein BCT32_04860 [Vibrio sp. 10N.261.45.E11]